MNCETVQQSLLMEAYGELPDELSESVERHLGGCETCQREGHALQALDAYLALYPVVEPSPNLLAQSRMRLDEALDHLPPHGLLTRISLNFHRWTSYMRSAPALMTLLVGTGFLAGNFTYRFQVAHAPKPSGLVAASNAAPGVITNITDIAATSNHGVVQVHYNRVVPESVEGSLDSPEIRQLLLLGMSPGADPRVNESSVNLLSNECKVGHSCAENDGKGIRGALLVSLRYDRNAGVRLKALEGLQPYIGQDRRVRDAVLEALMHDTSAGVRTAAIGLLTPVESDSSVRQVLRTVSARDNNPFIRTASYQALQGAAEIQ
jgi:hypothetical protein